MSELQTALSSPSGPALLPAPRSPVPPAQCRRLLDVGRLQEAVAAYLRACGVADGDAHARVVDGLLASPATVESLVRPDGSIDTRILQQQIDRALAPLSVVPSAETEQTMGCGRLMHVYGSDGVTYAQWRREMTVRDESPVEMPVQSLSGPRAGATVGCRRGSMYRFVRAPAHAVLLLVSVLLGGK